SSSRSFRRPSRARSGGSSSASASARASRTREPPALHPGGPPFGRDELVEIGPFGHLNSPSPCAYLRVTSPAVGWPGDEARASRWAGGTGSESPAHPRGGPAAF